MLTRLSSVLSTWLAMATLLEQITKKLESGQGFGFYASYASMPYLVVLNASCSTVATLVSSHCTTADATRTLRLKYTFASLPVMA